MLPQMLEQATYITDYKLVLYNSYRSPGMFHDFTSNLAIFVDICADLLRQRDFLVVAIFTLNNIQVNSRAFTCENLCVHALFTQVDLCTVNLIHKNRRQCASHLHGEI